MRQVVLCGVLKISKTKRLLLDWYPCGAELAWLLALGWWLVLGWTLRRSLRPALGGAAGNYATGPLTKPRRPKVSPRPRLPRLSFPSAA